MLRWVKCNYKDKNAIQYVNDTWLKLQYRNPAFTKYSDYAWTDVPLAEDKPLKWCYHIVDNGGKWECGYFDVIDTDMYCRLCGEPRPGGIDDKGKI